MFDDFIIAMFFTGQFEYRLKEVAMESQVVVDIIQEGKLFRGFKAVITNQMADHRSIFLFNMGLIILSVWARMSEVDMFIQAITIKDIVDEFSAII